MTGVDVVIVNWNTAQRAIEAAVAFAGSSDVTPRIFIVDNDSSPDQRNVLRAGTEDLFELIEPNRNLGFGSAANLGVSRGENPYVVVTNADVSPQSEALAELVRAKSQHPDSGMVGPVFSNGGNHYHDNLPGPLTLLARSVVGSFGRESVQVPGRNRVISVEQPSGACFLVDRATWNDCGGFDERFFLWYEDVDLARRLHDSGKTSLIVGGARVEHIGGETFNRLDAAKKHELRLESLYLYIRIHHPVLTVFARPLIILSRRLRFSRLKR